MKHAAIKPSSAAKTAAARVVATIALATAATAVASPAMANDNGGRGGCDDSSAGYDGRDGGYGSGQAPQSYEPTNYSEPNYDVPSYESQQSDDGGNEAASGWDEEEVREAIREYTEEANTPAPAPEPQAEVVEAVQPKAPAPAKEPAPAPAASTPVEQAAAEETAASEPPLAVQAPGQQWEGTPTAETTGAEFVAYVPSQGIEQEASALTEATLDAPVRLATTGAEAAALTAGAGALVIGGAGSLLVARRGRARA